MEVKGYSRPSGTHKHPRSKGARATIDSSDTALAVGRRPAALIGADVAAFLESQHFSLTDQQPSFLSLITYLCHIIQNGLRRS
jgi:hypothetical protein